MNSKTKITHNKTGSYLNNPILKTDPSLYRSTPIHKQAVKNFESHIIRQNQALKSKSKSKLFKSPFQSASTLQVGVNLVSFSKAERFPKTLEKDNISTMILLPSTLKSRNFNIGLGKKNYLPKFIEINAREYPSPSAYLSHEDPPQKGKTFGLSYAHYRKNYIPESRIPNLEINKKLPGPGKYELDRELGDLNVAKKRRIKMTMKGKTSDFIDEEIRKDQSPKKFYFPPTDSVFDARYNKITFGKGDKFDFTYSPNNKEFPGPGQYEIKAGIGFKKRKRK